MVIKVDITLQSARSRFLKTDPYERTNHWQGYANDYNVKTINSRVDEVQLAIPQSRYK